MHFRLKGAFDIVFELLEERVGIVARQVTDLEIERALVGNDIERSAPFDGASVDGGVRDIEAAVIGSVVAVTPREPFEKGNCLRCRFDGIHAARRIRGMTREATHHAAIAFLALVSDHRAHERGLAYDARCRLDPCVREVVDQTLYAYASQLLVIRE